MVMCLPLLSGRTDFMRPSSRTETFVSLGYYRIMSLMARQPDDHPPADSPPHGPRERQTRRTRRALIAAADELFADGRVPTVAEVAERADVARATAYRYFPTQEALLLETTFLGDSEPLRSLPELAREIADPSERMAEAVRRGAEWSLGREARLRAILRMSLDPDSELRRPARRRGYIVQLLEDIRAQVPSHVYERLAAAMTLLMGIDPIVSLRDNSDIDRDRIPDALAWTARELVAAALREAQTNDDDRCDG
jgi:AcrR family transcriptional regulator